MTGYDYIKSLTIKELMKKIDMPRGKAYYIREICGLEKLTKHPYLCPRMFAEKHRCSYHETGCQECMYRWLVSDIDGSKMQCATCIEADICNGQYLCKRLTGR